MQGYLNFTQVILASAARTASSATNAFRTKSTEALRIYINCTAKTGTNPTIVATIDVSPDGTTWYIAKTLTTITNTGQYTDSIIILGEYVRVSYTIGGTDTPGYTFSILMTKGSPVR